MFLGWVVVLIVDECVALSLGEFASKYPTSAGPYYWSFQLASPSVRTVLSFITGMSFIRDGLAPCHEICCTEIIQWLFWQ